MERDRTIWFNGSPPIKYITLNELLHISELKRLPFDQLNPTNLLVSTVRVVRYISHVVGRFDDACREPSQRPP